MKLTNKEIKDLLKKWAVIMNRLREAGILRSSNNPTADYAEFLVAKKLNLKLMSNSTSSYDAIDTKTRRKYQIKARRFTKHRMSRQMGVMRNLERTGFDYLGAVIFDEDFNVKECYIIPRKLLLKYAKKTKNPRFSKHQNGYIFFLRGKILQDKKVKMLKF